MRWCLFGGNPKAIRLVTRTLQAVFPFLVGILEFAQISALGPTTLGLWFAILGLLFAAMGWISHVTMKRARQDADNEHFFANTNPATWRDHLLRAVPVTLLFTAGFAVWVSNDRGWLSFSVLIGAIALLGFQIWMNHIYSRKSYA